jgi:DNA-binding FadR family transcriptional regulator
VAGVTAEYRGDIARELRIPKAAELIAAHLRRQIVRHELEGDTLPSEAKLITEFHASRPTVREAHRILESEGLITVRRGAHGGARVHRPSADLVARYAATVLQANGALLTDLYEARTAIEAPAAGMLARRRSADDVAQLRAIYEEPGELDGSLVPLLESHHRFHTAVIDLAGNMTIALLTRVIDAILEAANFQHVEVRLDDDTKIRCMKRAQRTHIKLIELIEHGDPVAAETLWHKHLENAARLVLSANSSATTLDVMRRP